MRLKFISFAAIFFAIILTIASCSKEGKTGPAGPAGPAGPTGAAGPAGATGTANVIYSPWIDTISYFLTSSGSDTIFGDLTVPRIDLNMLSRGEMKVYVNLNTSADPLVVPLPYNDGDGGFIHVFFYLGGLQLVSNINIDGLPIRYVLIPGGTAARYASGTKPVNWNNYAEVKEYLGLKD